MLTTVYDTPPEYLRETAESLLAQTAAPFEWILLDNGSKDQEIIDLIREISHDRRVQHLRVTSNLGIVGGMRRCLEAARCEYVVPLDSDDVLVPDALALLDRAISDSSSPEFVYTDEDVLRDGRSQSPYLRPDWDPVLNICTSYVFHLCAFRREDALRLGVYSDDRVEWCHDWDTIHRFHADRARIVHVPEVAYHWRAHQLSSTHRAEPESGSLESQRHVLQRIIGAHEHPELFELQLFPIDRGAPEWWVRRRRERPTPLDVILVASVDCDSAVALDRLTESTDYPFGKVTVVTQPHLAGLARAVHRDEDRLVAVCSSDVCPEGSEWAWEAAGLCDLHADAVLVSGRVLNRDRIVVAGGEIIGFDGLIGVPDRGRSENDPGYYALALKQRSVSACNPAFFLARTTFLRTALASLPPEATPRFLGAWLGAAAFDVGRRVVFSPLVTAFAPGVFTGEQTPGPLEAERFSTLYSSLIPDDRWYSRHFARERGNAYEVKSSSG